MGLFKKNKNKIEGIELQVLQSMQDSPLINVMVDIFTTDSECEWMRACKHSHQNQRRDVIVVPEGICVEIPGARERKDKSGYAIFHFNELGFDELTAHYNQQGKIDIETPRMCYLYATAIRNRLSAVLPDFKFSAVSQERDTDIGNMDAFLYMINLLLTDSGKYAKFHYEVPAFKGSNLF